MSTKKKLFFVLICAALSACSVFPKKPSVPTEKNYYAAIGDAAVATPQKVLPLLPLAKSGTVDVVSWVSDSRVPCEGKQQCEYTTGNYIVWVTQAGEVQKKCASWNLKGVALRERLEELLGLPHGSPAAFQKTRFVKMTVAATALSRPCLGLEEKNGNPVCTLVANTSVSPEQQRFVMQQMAGSYVDQNPQGPGYPFTRLGYTYDWSQPVGSGTHYGASEFLLAERSLVKVESVQLTDDYCAIGQR